MADAAAERQVLILAALAQPTRLQILARLADAGSQGLAAGEIARSIRCPASTLSFHLKELSRTGILEARPRGRFIIYGLQRPALEELARYIGDLAGAGTATRPRKAATARSEGRGRSGDRDQLQMFGD
jgi:ArsR family transcriptional regulator, arsenate/arsenite/antimonite-responsive transcriptional repressor